MTIAQAPWFKRTETQAVLAALEAVRPGGARFVGGCVRNTLLRAPVDDVDLATQLLPDQVIDAAHKAGLSAVPTGIEHGTITVIANHVPHEVTTLRRDVETDGRRATVAFTEDWAEDAARRDFRMNALYADAHGDVHDPTGSGLEDVRAGRVIFIGDAHTRIREDYLRILRFFRFNAWYGRGALDADGLAACAALKDGMAQLSAERVWKELKKLLAAPDPSEAWRAMETAGVRSVIAPEAQNAEQLLRVIAIDAECFFEPDALTRLAALLADERAARALAQRLKVSNEEKDRLTAAMGRAPRIVSFLSPKEVRRALYVLGKETFADRVKLAWAEEGNPKTVPQWRALLAMAESWLRPKLPLTGEEVMAAGVPAGPKIGQALREVEAWWIDSDFPDDKLSVVERLKAVAQGIA
ncbi:MAG: CCA tRNA nucleotidyltransferase [Alphaproteobacteria bacterium]|nr:CCA tRNA nucleotidyltransferase [Alphaproteobacteria bacterium]